MAKKSNMGRRVRSLRRQNVLTQAQLAEKLGISASYLNLIESNRRPLPAALLIKLARTFGVDLHAFGGDDDARIVHDLLEAFSDPAFDTYQLASPDLRELAVNHPQVARAVLALYRSYKTQREASDALASRLDGEEQGAIDRSQLPSEEVNELIQGRVNHFPELEEGAEQLWQKGRLEAEELYPGLVRYLDKQHGVHVRIARSGAERRHHLQRRNRNLEHRRSSQRLELQPGDHRHGDRDHRCYQHRDLDGRSPTRPGARR